LQNRVTRTAVLEALLAVRTKLDAAKLAPYLNDAATALLASNDVASEELGAMLASGYKLGGAEPALVKLLQAKGTTAPVATAALRALAEMGGGKTDLIANLAESAADPTVRDEAVSALASSKSADAPARVLALFAKLAPSQQRNVLTRLSATKSGASAIVAATASGTLAKTSLDGAVLDRLQVVLGDKDPALQKLLGEVAAFFRPVLALDGSEEAWSQTSLTLDGPCTIEAWVKLDPKGRPISNADGVFGVPGVLDVNFASAKFRVYAGPKNGDVVIARKPMIPDLWTHLAATRNAQGIWKIYFDGDLDATGTKPAPGPIVNPRIAWTTARGGTQGALSELRVWNIERNADEIRSASDRSLPSSTPGLVFTSAGGEWGQVQAGAKVVKTSDYPPILTPDEAATLDAKYAKYRALAGKSGDKERGKAVAAVCQACHTFGTTGGNIGPILSGIGAMGTEGILRNILQPSAAMENGYRIFRVEMKNGDLVDALYVSEDKDAIVVRMPGIEDRRIPRSEIRSTKYLRRSLMPEGLLESMTDAQVTDLMSYLTSLKGS
jgi:putative heme-binding domain-containing protein